MTIIIICLGESDDKNYDGIIKMLDVLLSRKVEPKDRIKQLHDEFDIIMTEEMERQAVEMCNLSQGIENSAVDRTNVNVLMNMMKNSSMSLDECMNMIEVPDYLRAEYCRIIEESNQLQTV